MVSGHRSRRHMSLTYQPFAESSSINELSRDLRMNVSNPERVVSGFVGSFLAAAAISRRGPIRWILLAASAAMVGRAWTGQCGVYRSLGADSRHPADRSSANLPRRAGHATQDAADEDYELRYSAKELDVRPGELRAALKNVGQRSQA